MAQTRMISTTWNKQISIPNAVFFVLHWLDSDQLPASPGRQPRYIDINALHARVCVIQMRIKFITGSGWVCACVHRFDLESPEILAHLNWKCVASLCRTRQLPSTQLQFFVSASFLLLFRLIFQFKTFRLLFSSIELNISAFPHTQSRINSAPIHHAVFFSIVFSIVFLAANESKRPVHACTKCNLITNWVSHDLLCASKHFTISHVYKNWTK